jgi:hypothetical protein
MTRSLVRIASAFAVCALFGLATAVSVQSCASTPDPSRYTVIFTPDFNQFKNGGVNDFLAQRCATLDCHGQVGRPLRLYSRTGLRILNDAMNVPGGSGLTDDEITANFQSVVGLEPEHMSQVVADPTGNPPQLLLFIGKPRNLIVHKGGQVIVPLDDGDTCLVTWVTGNVNTASCQAANQVP